jgi:peptidoglycan/LPS O-acetylase OafA/YrhL
MTSARAQMPSRDPSSGPVVLAYRRDIDGLRALAVVPVLLYHAHVPGFEGGFVGVDVFFVISGFLITSILLGDIESGNFSISRFYERRCRRILPPLLLVLLASMGAGFALLAPADFRAFAQSALWLSFFFSNVHFNREFGYFDAAADAKPLLHTWSLSIEEQFYIVFPLLLFFGLRYARKHLLGSLAILTLLSMLLSIDMTAREPARAFYLIQYRAWELGIGALLAFWALRRTEFGRFSLREPSQGAREAAAALGLLFILVPVVAYTPATVFPGVGAVPPCLGASLIIWANTGGATFIGRALSLAPIVSVGLISYSLYLWHWPLLVFARIRTGESLSSVETALVLLASACIAWASLHFVERPFRKRTLLPTRVQALSASVTALALMATVGFAFSQNRELIYRVRGEITLAEPLEPMQPDVLENLRMHELSKGIQVGTFGKGRESSGSFLVIGDSFGNQWIPALSTLARKHDIPIHIQVIASCPSLINTTTSASETKWKTPCLQRNRMYADFLRHGKVAHVVLASLWRPFVNDEPRSDSLWVAGEPPPQGVAQSDILKRQLSETLEFFRSKGVSVWIAMPPPYFPYHVPNELFKFAREKKPLASLYLSKKEVILSRQPVFDLFSAMASEYDDVRLLDPLDLLCRGTSCPTEEDGNPLYLDYQHLTYHGSLYGRNMFMPIVREVLAAKPREYSEPPAETP